MHVVAAYCKRGNELLGFIKVVELFGQLSEYQSLRDDFPPLCWTILKQQLTNCRESCLISICIYSYVFSV